MLCWPILNVSVKIKNVSLLISLLDDPIRLVCIQAVKHIGSKIKHTLSKKQKKIVYPSKKRTSELFFGTSRYS